MFEIESAANWITVIANIAIAIFILIKVNRLSGLIFVAWFSILAVQFVLLTGATEIVKVEMVNGVPTMTSPLWYKVFLAVRSLVAILSPLALYLLAKQVIASRERKNA